MDSKDVAVSNSTPYISDGDAVLVGMPRLRQLRVMKGKQRVLMTREIIYSIYIYIFKLTVLILVIPLNMFNVYMSKKLLSVQ